MSSRALILPRARRAGPTRERLVGAAVELMRAQGASSLTASGIAKAAGIAPQNFYVYFENAEECIGLAVETVASRISTVISALRADMHRTAPADAEILAQHYEQVLNLIVAEGRLWEIFSRFHRDSSPLGVALRQIALQGRTDLVTDLWRLAQTFGYSEAYRNAVEVQAEIIVASIHGVAEALVDGRIHDVRMASVALAQGTIHATQTLFAATSVQTST